MSFSLLVCSRDGCVHVHVWRQCRVALVVRDEVCACMTCVRDCMHAWPLVLTDLRYTIFSFFFRSIQLRETSVPVPQTGM